MSTRSSTVCGKLEARLAPPVSDGSREWLPDNRVPLRSSSARRLPISTFTCSMDSSRKVSTSFRFWSTSAASRLTFASSLVFILTSWRNPATSISASAVFRLSEASNDPLSFSNSRVELDTNLSNDLTLVESSLISFACRCPCLAYSLAACSFSATSRLSRRLSSSVALLAFWSSSVSRTCSRNSSAIRRFSKRIFLVEASSRSTASSCEVFFISASICLYSFCSLAFSSKNLRSIASAASLRASCSSANACSLAANWASYLALFSL
mmetsp:Transcript_26877/g.81367  ORF Transcript_26877/g.81367 Transcript_26877/m.81367 type:complete len:267 (+) Transcript_26877:602-1402(+)